MVILTKLNLVLFRLLGYQVESNRKIQPLVNSKITFRINYIRMNQNSLGTN